jgi:predicted nucleotidyltransferase component of viral defense system
MIESREIVTAAENVGLTPQVVEKDYVLGWMLASIYQHPRLKDSWVFKGGTCLKKCYFETYRFSEDLDFTITDAAHIDQAFLLQTFKEISAWLNEHAGIELPQDRLRFDVFQNRRDRPAAQGRASYRGPMARGGGELPRIKLDLTSDERVVLAPITRPVNHPYSDVPNAGISARCYSFEEIFGEKMRALGERTRPRDLYDVINLFRNADFHPAAAVILDVLRQKCEFKGVTIPTMETLLPARAELEADWPHMLGHQLPALPPLDSFWNELPQLLQWLMGGQGPATPAAYPLDPGESIVRGAAGSIRLPGIATTHIEVIRFAASNHLCVDLTYNGSVRRIEPYSLRRTRAGDVVLHAVRSDNQEHRSYRVDRLQNAQATNQTFTPRYAIELTPTGPIAAPVTMRAASSPSPFRLRASRAVSSSPRTGPTYIYQSPVCQKQFKRTTHDSALRPHKNTNGWPCPGRHGYLVDTRY